MISLAWIASGGAPFSFRPSSGAQTCASTPWATASSRRFIETEAVDYRYATLQAGRAATFEPYEPDDALAERCVRLAVGLGLEVAGIDLKLAPDGSIVCLEVNPSPVFSYYELHTEQPISDAIARLLDPR